MITVPQLMFKKDYFMKNIDKIKDFVKGRNLSLIENPVFVSIPLLKILKIKNVAFDSLSKSFQMKFLDKLYSLYHQKKIWFSLYPYFLLLSSLKNNFILKSLYLTIRDKDKLNKIINKI
jgi:hypothetical protein